MPKPEPPLPTPDELPALDPGSPEPEGELHLDDEPWLSLPDLASDEPEGSSLEALPDFEPREDLGLEDFVTQEELPILPWSLEADLLERGCRIPATLEPSLAATYLEQPGGGEPFFVTVRLRMLDLRLLLPVRPGPGPHLHVGRDLIAGKLLIRVDAP